MALAGRTLSRQTTQNPSSCYPSIVKYYITIDGLESVACQPARSGLFMAPNLAFRDFSPKSSNYSPGIWRNITLLCLLFFFLLPTSKNLLPNPMRHTVLLLRVWRKRDFICALFLPILFYLFLFILGLMGGESEKIHSGHEMGHPLNLNGRCIYDRLIHFIKIYRRCMGANLRNPRLSIIYTQFCFICQANVCFFLFSFRMKF